MTRTFVAGVVGIVAALTAACGEPRTSAGEILYLQTGTGVTIVESAGGEPKFYAARAVPSHDWSTIVRTAGVGRSTEISAVDPSSGIQRWAARAPGRLRVKIVSRDGDVAVLEPSSGRYENNPTVTRFVVARRGGPGPQVIRLEGNFAAEALSADAENLFVVQYRPARNPNRYQVRRLDLGTGEVHDVLSADAELQESMRGTARIQTMSTDGSRLYTLYTLRSSGIRYAFIHVLALGEDELWAHCIDLPAEFARAPQAATALTVSPDGRRLYVANAREDVVAEVDTEKLAVARTASVEFEAGESTYAATGVGSALYLASGETMMAVDVGSLSVTRSWDMKLPVTGLQVGADAGRVYVGQGLKISIVDVDGGNVLGSFDPPGVGAIGTMGKVIRTLDDIRTEILCAC